jgi:hypothetical protein
VDRAVGSEHDAEVRISTNPGILLVTDTHVILYKERLEISGCSELLEGVCMKINKPAAHIDQMLRQTRVHHVQLSMMADQKASMLITVCAIIIPLTAHFLSTPHFRLVAFTLICFSVLTMLLAIYTAMPGIHKPESIDVAASSFNPLFFADFRSMDYEEYETLMEDISNDPSRVYEAQIREIYLLGQYLANYKYKYLRLAYLSFLSGIVTSGIIWIVTIVFYS